ncbi:ABC transporter ATP-binding protein [Salinibacillus xinjiangensis]|uniref:ATP-binding cassette domain-containing protein n=1 Tax=Salinibacillus xinjiangensis TaxID=1229268 RepID=A0A6G1XBC2_9BACI|nr:ABC transporter ATP-binding protein [Salinibacillus xinjiangensis]MRG88088.1 ATP-binding cassette domain-containing protein [Salinibacillus xinjiangensis]
MNDVALTLKNIDFRYGQSEKVNEALFIFENLHLYLRKGEFVSIIGPSGSGKSTIFRLITGLEHSDAGTILIDGKETGNRLGEVGYMPQEDLLMPWRTIIENAALPLEIQGMKKVQAYHKVRPLLAEIGLGGYEDYFPKDLSGGMKQRVSFLRAALTGSHVLLLDEPFSALDAITRISMQEWLLKQWRMLEKSILFITHDVNEALFLSDRIYVLTGYPKKPIQEITVPLNRPRQLLDLNKPKMLALKDQLIGQLRGGSR